MMECDMGRFVDSWHTNLEEMDDTWWVTVHLLLHKPLALTDNMKCLIMRKIIPHIIHSLMAVHS